MRLLLLSFRQATYARGVFLPELSNCLSTQVLYHIAMIGRCIVMIADPRIIIWWFCSRNRS